MMRVEGEQAYILHQRPYRETSYITELFSHSHGRISVVSKGARRQSKKGSNSPMPFQLYIAGWTGRTELMTLTQLEPEGRATELKGECLYCGLYINELLMRLLHQHDAHDTLFTRYSQCLQQLETGDAVQTALRLFERDLLSELGYGLVLDHDIQDQSVIEPDVNYDYIIDAGPRRLGVAPASGVIVKGSSLVALSAGRLDAESHSEIKHLMRSIIDAQLDGKPLHSRTMMLKMRKNTVQSGQHRTESRES